MGFFKKAKENFQQGQANAANAQAMAAAGQAEQAAGAAEGKIGVDGMMANPAAFGGPSTTPLAADDPLLQPVNGVSLEQYARVAKECQRQGVTDEAGVGAVAEQMGVASSADMQAAVQEWTRRMQQSMVVGQQFNKVFMAL